MTARLTIAIAALLAAATDAANEASQCAAVKTCYEGGDQSVPCVVTEEECPPCVLFDGNSCYVRVSGSCPFGTDCSDVFFSSSGSSTATSSSTNNTVGSGSTKDSTTSVAAGTPSAPTSRAGSLSSQASSAGGEATAADSGDTGSSAVLVVTILVIAALGMWMLFLVVQAASEGIAEDEVPSPPTTEMSSFSSNDTIIRDAGAVVARSTTGTDLSEAKTNFV
ncbi:putative carbohydrate-binding protein [Phytophthora cinnamomi]|uniref:putative carbohydrate-binding protein n=1 Tax=Phytophthora cinnamomi TaxID=4785 RepID=UPI00355974C5|nr:putative carbohydrate-binding protein [Phytophthora cinnamomi]